MARSRRSPERRAAVAVPVGLLAALLLALTACGGSGAGATTAQLHSQPVDPPFQVASTSLTDTDGDDFTLASADADTGHRLTLAFFGYTHCPDICGLVMANLAAAMTRLDPADRKQVQVVFVTTDPQRDSETVLRRYLDHYDPAFVGLTGPIQSIVDLGRSVAVGMGTPLPGGGYDVNAHSTQVTLVDRDGQAPMYWHQDVTAAQYAADIHALLSRS